MASIPAVNAPVCSLGVARALVGSIVSLVTILPSTVCTVGTGGAGAPGLALSSLYSCACAVIVAALLGGFIPAVRDANVGITSGEIKLPSLPLLRPTINPVLVSATAIAVLYARRS